MIEIVRTDRPLVHCITNLVTMDWVARGLAAAGARPVMARDRSEAALVPADALLLNLGTWSPETQEAMLAAGRAANERGIPVVLDPVGAGGMTTRTRAAEEILQAVQVSVIRGNAGEIAALAGESGHVSGVDSRAHSRPGTARLVARRYGCIVAATGPVDLVTDGSYTLEVRAGHPLMGSLPGMGCLAGALIAAFSATAGATVDSVARALLWSGLAGETASRAGGPGSFGVAILDALASTQPADPSRLRRSLDEALALYVIVSGTTPIPVLKAALEAGAGAIQFREKKLPLPDQVRIAREMRALCQEAGALFLVNDRVDLAHTVEADGVHLGQEDLPIPDARRMLGPRAIIGGTCETEAEARIAEASGADYIGTGPVYATPSKADAGEPYGPSVVKRVSGAVTIPVVGIGGIGIGGAAPVIEAGACGVSVISAVVGAPDPGAAARAILVEVLQAKGRMT